MSRIVICSQCGFQTEASKRFCPNCGAPIGAQVAPASPPSTKQVAASTLFSVLQDKKESNSQDTASAGSKPVTPKTKPRPSAGSSVAVRERKTRPTTFKQKPLGVAKPATTKRATTKAVLSKNIKSQLIGFLRELNKLDRNLEASAVVKRDGTLLASAHSSRAKPEMMATISSTLFGIAKDSIRAISGGKMRMVTITAKNIVLMLTHINEETILLLVTSPRSNLGLISHYSELVAQNISKFLAKLA